MEKMSDNNRVRLDASNWKQYVSALARLQGRLCDGSPLGDAIAEVYRLTEHYTVIRRDAFDDIADSYRLMCDYMVKGYDDDRRGELYAQLVRRLHRLVSDMILDARLRLDPSAAYLSAVRVAGDLGIDGLRERLESFVSDAALLSLEGGGDERAKAIYEERQAVVAKAFNGVVRSAQWSREQAGDVAGLLLSPTIDTADALVLCSAVMLAALFVPDPWKVFALATIYKDAADERLRQRALVGWVLALDGGDYSLFPELRALVGSLLGDGDTRGEIMELQMQVVYCMNAERDNETIQKDVMPTLLKNQNFEVTRYGIREKAEDPMDDILHGDETDKRMEEMESTIQRMADMQRQGVDIYFGGFSKMKRFGFFYTLCNWFMPFFLRHPGLEKLSDTMRKSGFLNSLFETGPFCDSDKYSFALGLSSVYDRLPSGIREVLNSGDGMHVLGDSGSDTKVPAFIRRMYLQDLYRFFRISDYRKMFRDPFSAAGGHLFMDNAVYVPQLHTEAGRVGRFLLKRKLYAEAGRLSERYYDVADVSDVLLRARLMMYRQDYAEAEELFGKVLEVSADDRAALRGCALASFYNGHYTGAAELYGRLTELYPDKPLYRLNLAISLINGNKASEGVSTLYELYYKLPDDIDVKRALAWGLLCTKRTEQSMKLYKEILEADSKAAADSLNAGYCAWFNGKLEMAVGLFKDYVRAAEADGAKAAGEKPSHGENKILSKFKEDGKLLDAYGIPQVNRLIMAGMAAN